MHLKIEVCLFCGDVIVGVRFPSGNHDSCKIKDDETVSELHEVNAVKMELAQFGGTIDMSRRYK